MLAKVLLTGGDPAGFGCLSIRDQRLGRLRSHGHRVIHVVVAEQGTAADGGEVGKRLAETQHPVHPFLVADVVDRIGLTRAVGGDCLDPGLVQLGETLHSWSTEIATMWRFTRNNGITEGFHNKMELINRQAFGFRNFQNYRLRVKVLCG